MAIYSLEDFKSLVISEKWTYFNENRAFKHLNKLNWGDGELANVLCSLDSREDFRKSFTDQIVNDLPGKETVHADHYVINWDIEEWTRKSYEWVRRNNYPISTVELSIKIAIVQNETGQLAGVVNFHTSGSMD